VTPGVLIHPSVIKVVSELEEFLYTVYKNSSSSLTPFITVGCIRTARVTDNIYYSRVFKNSSSHWQPFNKGCQWLEDSYTPYCNKSCQWARGVLVHPTIIKVSVTRGVLIHPTVIKVVSDQPLLQLGVYELLESLTTFITVGCIRTPRVTDNLYYSRVYKNSSSHW
jgi:hypothetical protein